MDDIPKAVPTLNTYLYIQTEEDSTPVVDSMIGSHCIYSISYNICREVGEFGVFNISIIMV